MKLLPIEQNRLSDGESNKPDGPSEPKTTQEKLTLLTGNKWTNMSLELSTDQSRRKQFFSGQANQQMNYLYIAIVKSTISMQASYVILRGSGVRFSEIEFGGISEL